MEISVAVKNSREDFKKLYEDALGAKKYLFYANMILVVVLYFAAAFSVAAMIRFKNDGLVLNAALAFALAVYKTKSMLQRKGRAAERWANRMYDIFSKDVPERTAAFFADKIVFKSEISEVTASPADIYSIYFSDDAVYVYLSKASVYCVMKKNFSSEELWNEFYALAKENYCATKRVHFKKTISKKDVALAVIMGLLVCALICARFWIR